MGSTKSHVNLANTSSNVYGGSQELNKSNAMSRTESMRNSICQPTAVPPVAALQANRKSIIVKRREDKIEGTSEISVDEWGEIQKYNSLLAQD